jgi:hypothetical protein
LVDIVRSGLVIFAGVEPSRKSLFARGHRDEDLGILFTDEWPQEAVPGVAVNLFVWCLPEHLFFGPHAQQGSGINELHGFLSCSAVLASQCLLECFAAEMLSEPCSHFNDADHPDNCEDYQRYDGSGW